MNAGKQLTATVAARCPNCGRRSVEDGICSACGSSTIITRREITPATSTSPAMRQMFPVSLTSVQPARTIIPVAPVTRPRVDLLEDPWAFIRGSELSGRVIILRQAPNEPMDFDPWRWVAIPVWGLLLLITPVVGAIVTWKMCGFLPAAGVAVVSLVVLRFIFSDRLLQTWHLTSALNGRQVVESMPVLMARLRGSDERETQLRLKGHLDGGTLMEGDRIRARGNLSRGVLKVRGIVCERTGASIVPRQPNARNLAIIGTCVLVIATLWLVHAGIPWVKDQANGFRPSLRQPALQNNFDLQMP